MLLLLAISAPMRAMPVCLVEIVGDRDFFGISGSSDSNVIGVGQSGRIFRDSGAGWNQMLTPTNADLNDVEVVDSATAFAVGDGGAALQLVGGVWVDRSGFSGDNLYGVWAASATEAYAVGRRGDIFRYNGITWTDESSAAGTGNRDIEDVWGDAGNVYAMSERGELYVYNRQSNTWAPRDDLCQAGGNAFRDIWGDGQGNLYLVRRGDVYRHDGSSCQIVASAGENLNGIYGGADGQIYAGGRNGTVLHFDGSVWRETTETNEDINDVWVSPGGTAYFGGDNRQIVSCAVVVPKVVGDWPLDDCTMGFDGSVVIDTGPNGLNGSTVGGVQVAADGQLCSAAGMNGSSAYVSVPDNAALDLSDGVSIAVWVRHNNASLKDWEAVVAKGDSSFRLHLNGGCEIPDSLAGNTRHGFTLGLNGGCGGADLNSNVVPSPGVWYHVAATYDRTVMRIYINGNLVNSANYAAAINTNNFDLFIGENSQQRGRYWNGDIDELVIWDQAITPQQIATHMNRTRPCVSCASAEFVLTHDNYGIHCIDETVTVDVVDSIAGLPRLDYNAQITLDTQTGNGTWTLVSGAGVFTDAVADDGIATYEWPLLEDDATFALEYRQGDAVFDIDVYQTSDGGIRDNDAEGDMTFSASGFTVTATPLANPPGVIVPFSLRQTAAVDFPIYVTAYGQTPADPVCGVIENYDGARDLQIWFDHVNPVTGSIAPTIDGISAATSEASAGTRSVTFTAGQAQLTGRYKDAGAIQLFFNDDNVADPNLPNGILGGTAPFVVKPFRFALSGIGDAGGTPNPAPADASGPAFVAAGAPFTATVAALDADGDVTPNYGREAIPESVALSARLVSPGGGNNPGITFGTGFGPFAGGQATGTDFTWPEVGIITLTPSVGDGEYLNEGDVVGSDSVNVGRFYPDHFTAAITGTPSFATACGPGSFTYIGQPFGYASPPVITLTARARDNAVTANYAGLFFRIDNSTLLNRSYSAVTGVLDTSGLPALAGDPVITELGAGLATLTFSSGAGLAFSRGLPEAPFDAEISLAIDVFDGDGVAALTNPVTVGSPGGILFSNGSQMRYGRVRLLNGIGSELVDLNVPMRSEYFDSAATGFVQNADDSCTGAVTLALGAFTNNLDLNDSCVIENGSPGASGIGCPVPGPAGLRYREPPAGGDFNLYLRAPGANNDGSTAVTADVPAWLRFDWDVALPGLENPAGVATFGIYRGEDRRIYTRELY